MFTLSEQVYTGSGEVKLYILLTPLYIYILLTPLYILLTPIYIYHLIYNLL